LPPEFDVHGANAQGNTERDFLAKRELKLEEDDGRVDGEVKVDKGRES